MFLRNVATRLLTATKVNKAVPNSNLLVVLKRNMATENKQNTTWVKDIKDGEFVRRGKNMILQHCAKVFQIVRDVKITLRFNNF